MRHQAGCGGSGGTLCKRRSAFLRRVIEDTPDRREQVFNDAALAQFDLGRDIYTGS
ncbi:hypothetical protein NB231_00185 [Nitrococcus mobilis Nb-231]|uniref:Uncharacterized protein n=1 Tax=Nitrococcus mobilis Nb-231 TaxID=314278 RepID=A4BTK0_9GAMM|nr:hypothetical protein NB231_00185 [Nitrococcus mobilis Nb-231]